MDQGEPTWNGKKSKMRIQISQPRREKINIQVKDPH